MSTGTSGAVGGLDVGSMQAMLEAQFKQTLDQFNQMARDNSTRITEFRERLFGGGKSDLTDTQQADVSQIIQVLNRYPNLISVTKIYLATVLRRTLENEALLGADPTKTLAMLDKFQAVLRENVPQELWPESLKPKEASAEVANEATQ